MKTALITSTGSVAADIVCKSLKRVGFRVVGCNIYPKEWIVESCEVSAFYQAPPVAKSDEYLDFMKELCIKEKVQFLLPMIDYELDLLSINRTWFDEHGVTLCMSPTSTLAILRNKKKLSDYVAEHCTTIKSIPTSFLCDIEQLKWEFPIVCKPNDGRSSQGLQYIHNLAEWNDFKNSVEKSNYIVEPFIDGPRIVVEVIRDAQHCKTVALVRRELLSTPHGCSLTVLVYEDKALENEVKQLADMLGVVGDVNFEFILDANGIYHLIECNPRFSAGCEFSCMGGYDCVENHMKCFMGEEIEEYHFKHNMIIARKYEEFITATNINVDYCKTNG